jgi:hypothetical protein
VHTLGVWMKTLRSKSGCALVVLLLLAVSASQTADARMSPPQSAAAAFDQSKVPAVVYIIRHAEKPLGGEKNPDLAPQGFKRAQVLATLFLQQPGSTRPPRLPRPDVLFATDFSKNSKRPIETITPLAKALNLPINHDYADLETGALAKQVLSGKYAGKVVLICWHHGEIPHLAQAFGVTDAPRKWDETVFDRIWMIEWLDGKPQFSMLPENVLPGDSTN